MKIYGNSELINLRSRIDGLLNKFTSELESVNNEYNPTFVKLKKRKDNIVYYIVLTIFLVVFISIAIFLGVLEAFYLILIAYGINLLLTGYGLILYKMVNKEYSKVKGKWDKAYAKTLKYQDEVSGLYKLAEEEVYKTMTLTLYHDELENINNRNKYDSFFAEKFNEIKLNIEKELGTNHSSEAVISYYDEWGANLTNQDKANFDFLEARRRKAMLNSKNIDIDGKGE